MVYKMKHPSKRREKRQLSSQIDQGNQCLIDEILTRAQRYMEEIEKLEMQNLIDLLVRSFWLRKESLCRYHAKSFFPL